MVKEILVNKGSSMKKLRIMGRGRTGVGMIRKTHITVKLEVINFEEKIEDAETQTQKKKWALRRDMVNKLKNNSSTAVTTTTTTSA